MISPSMLRIEDKVHYSGPQLSPATRPPLNLNFMCIDVLIECRGQDTKELELEMVISYSVGTRTQTWLGHLEKTASSLNH